MQQAVNHKGRNGCGKEAIFVYDNTRQVRVELCTLSHLELRKHWNSAKIRYMQHCKYLLSRKMYDSHLLCIIEALSSSPEEKTAGSDYLEAIGN